MGSKIDWGKVGTSAAGGVLGMIGGHLSERRNYRNERRLMALQYQNQRGLNQQGHDLQFDMWNKTNAEAQLKHYKDAGLNPALMYESGGPGGTTGSQTGGAAGKGSSQMMKAMDMQNMLLGAEIRLKDELSKTERSKQNDLLSQTKKRDGVDSEKTWQEIKNMRVQIDNIKADTNLKKEQADKLIADVKNVNEDTKLKLQQKINLITENDWRKIQTEIDKVKRDKKVTGSMIHDLLTIVGLDPVNNSGDQAEVQLLIGALFGAKMVDSFSRLLGSMRPGAQIGEILNNTVNRAGKKGTINNYRPIKP